MAEQKTFASLMEEIARACEGLIYISETDSPVTPFSSAAIVELSPQKVAAAAGMSNSADVETSPATTFFSRLTQERDWFGDREKENAKKFAELYALLVEHLRDLTVFRFGTIRIDIIVAGIDGEGNAAGIRTSAVET